VVHYHAAIQHILSPRLTPPSPKRFTLVRLSFLAPDIVRALLKGRQPIELTPTRLLRLSKDLPHDWIEQRHFLGFADGRSIISGQNAL
jgi:site-specific DNA recombinase